MADPSVTGPIRSAARAATSPVRNYLNQHFEQVKDEIRNQRPVVEIDQDEAWDRVADLENTLAEISLHHAQVLAKLTDQVAATNTRVAELERLVERLADVVAAMTVVRD
jgi:predicted GTPase